MVCLHSGFPSYLPIHICSLEYLSRIGGPVLPVYMFIFLHRTLVVPALERLVELYTPIEYWECFFLDLVPPGLTMVGLKKENSI